MYQKKSKNTWFDVSFNPFLCLIWPWLLYNIFLQVILLGIRTLHIIIRYIFHLYDLRQDGSASVSSGDISKTWEKRGAIAYYIELGFELTALTIDFFHHLHMLLWSNIFLSMASLVICMQLRYLFNEIQIRCKKHRTYLWVRNHLEQK